MEVVLFNKCVCVFFNDENFWYVVGLIDSINVFRYHSGSLVATPSSCREPTASVAKWNKARWCVDWLIDIGGLTVWAWKWCWRRYLVGLLPKWTLRDKFDPNKYWCCRYTAILLLSLCWCWIIDLNDSINHIPQHLQGDWITSFKFLVWYSIIYKHWTRH